MDKRLDEAAARIRDADALLIGAGAGIGVDSGLPDFRGDEGFWRAYPPLRQLGLSFSDMANPAWFQRDPELAWGFYGHRLDLYRRTTPHRGFAVLRRWLMARPGFVFTSNVDGHFQTARFDDDRILECHGSLRHVQCATPCSDAIWSADDLSVDVDPETFRARWPLPKCPRCGDVARPNVLMFGDGGWVPDRTERQAEEYRSWLRTSASAGRLVVIECGAGTAVPTVRMECERRGTLIRINVREPDVPADAIGLAVGARDALLYLAEQVAFDDQG